MTQRGRNSRVTLIPVVGGGCAVPGLGLAISGVMLIYLYEWTLQGTVVLLGECKPLQILWRPIQLYISGSELTQLFHIWKPTLRSIPELRKASHS